MNETKFLGGKVRKRSLQVFSPPAKGGLGPKRLLLSQGELANLYDGDEGIRYIALIELRAGAIRGNHVHRVKEEQVYLISGELELVVQEGEAGEKVTVEVHPGDLVEIDTGVAHAIKPRRPGYAVEFSRTRFDPTDVQRVTLF